MASKRGSCEAHPNEKAALKFLHHNISSTKPIFKDKKSDSYKKSLLSEERQA